MKKELAKFASVKMSREFVAWLKVEAARAGVPMYEFVERKFKRVRAETK